MWVRRNRVVRLILTGALLATAMSVFSTALAQPSDLKEGVGSAAPLRLSPHGGGVVTVEGSHGLEGFEIFVDGRELPRNLASSRNYFGKPASRRHVGYRRDPECQLRWPSQRVTANFFHGYGGVRSSCAPAAGTLLVEFGVGWSTDAGVRVGASVADLRQAYPGAKRHGAIWGLVESYPPWGGAIDVLAARVRDGRVVSLSVAGPEAWDE
jgi:hypothetical protein